MDASGVLVTHSLSNMSFGPESVDTSFVVLERVSADDTEKKLWDMMSSVRSINLNGSPAQSVSSYHLSDDPSAALVNGEAHSHISNETSVQQKMDSLIEENRQLQATVNHTNIALEQMMNTLSVWRVEMEKLRQEHKEKFQETRALVLTLKKEKAEMRQEIAELKIANAELINRAMPSLFDNLVPTVEEMELKAAIAELQSQLKVAEAAHQAEQEKSAAYEVELQSLKTDMSEMRAQLLHLDTLQKDAENHKTNLEELNILREENMRLKSDVQNLSSVERHSQDYQVAQAKGFTHKVDELTARLMTADEELQKAKADIAQLESQHASSSNNDEALNSARAAENRLRLRIDEMTAHCVELDQKCETQSQKIGALQEEVVRLLRENEAIQILQSQVQAYQADFHAERNCRERLAGEKEQLAEDLRRLHRHNLDLQTRLHIGVNVAAPGEGITNELNAEGPVQEALPTAFECPICGLSFRSLQSLNEHVDRCLVNQLP